MTHVKVAFFTPKDERGWPPVSVETLWAIPAGPGLYRLDNVPFFTRGVACEDVVRATPGATGMLQFEGIAEHGAHGTIRVYLADLAHRDALLQKAKDLGCYCEGSHIPKLLALDVPSPQAWWELHAWLVAEVAAGRLEYEEGKPIAGE